MKIIRTEFSNGEGCLRERIRIAKKAEFIKSVVRYDRITKVVPKLILE